MHDDDDFYDDAPASPADPYFTPLQLGTAMRLGETPPKLFGHNLLYPAKLHSIAGPPESGKTTLALYFALEVMRHGHPVLFVDEEAGPAQTASVLSALGAEPEIVDKWFCYLPYPSCGWNAAALKGLDDLMRDVRPVFSVWDSCAALMAAAGMDENSNTDCTRFWYTIMAPLVRVHRCSVLVTDHVAKSDEGSRYGRGAGAKLAAIDVMLKVNPLTPFTRGQDGLLHVRVTKDRPGWLHREYRVKVRHAPLSLEFMQSTAPDPADAHGQGMSPASRKLLSVLNGEPANLKQLGDRLADAFGHGLQRGTMSRELNELANAGLADRLDQGNGRPTLWTRAGAAPPGGEQMQWRPSGGEWTVDGATGEVIPDA